MPHPPQLSGSVLVLAQAPAHGVVPVGHDATQLPALQKLPVAQTAPQAPQFCGSDARRTQVPPHRV